MSARHTPPKRGIPRGGRLIRNAIELNARSQESITVQPIRPTSAVCTTGVATPANYGVIAPVRPVTSIAQDASVAPVRPARYALRWADNK